MREFLAAASNGNGSNMVDLSAVLGIAAVALGTRHERRVPQFRRVCRVDAALRIVLDV